MNKRRKLSTSNMVSKTKKVLSCSTPERHNNSPSHDSDSVYDSDGASPVPFLCTQDGTEGETDVVWNFYTPKSEAAAKYKNSTPLSSKGKRSSKPKLVEKPLPKRKPIKPSQRNMELFQELIELKQNLHEYINKPKKPQSDEDMFSDTSDSSPKSGLRPSSRCLRKNVLSSKFNKIEPENGLESDDSMNECLIKASQVVEEKVLAVKNKDTEACMKNKIEDESMDVILSNINLYTPSINKVKKYDSPRLNNDSFDNLLENLNDSALEKLTQMPIGNETNTKTPLNTKKELLKGSYFQESPTSSSMFGRHSSMPESPSAVNIDKPSTSRKSFGRYSSMPFNKSDVKDDSPIKCTPEEIKKKHQQAREKLLAKRTLPFTSTQQNSQPTLPPKQHIPDRPKKAFQPRVPTAKTEIIKPIVTAVGIKNNDSEKDIRMMIEKKRHEALLKLRKRQQK